jgi:uncharacterized protein YnzC (UPF0291/DUF896 family)
MDHALTASVAVEDIIDPTTYSIQESKLKSEKDRELHEAEMKKQAARDYITELRTEFLKVLDDIQKAPTGFVLNRENLKVDPYLREDIEQETEHKIKLVRKELAWISEKESIGPNKLKKKFLDDVETEYITISSFKTGKTLSTFRTTKLQQSYDLAAHAFQAAERAASKANKISGGMDQGPKANTETHGPDNVDVEKHHAARKVIKVRNYLVLP